MAAPPDPGSLQEALCILVFRYRQEQDFYAHLATLQPEGEEKVDAFKKFKAAKFPYIFKTALDERKRTRDILDRAFAHGPIRIKPEAEVVRKRKVSKEETADD